MRTQEWLAAAEWLGDATPDGIQYLLERARWDPEAARDELRRWVADYLGSPNGVLMLILDETGFIKKGQHSADVQRQYSDTAGRVENSQIGVFLCDAGPGGSVFIDRELYLPNAWAQDRERVRGQGFRGFHVIFSHNKIQFHFRLRKHSQIRIPLLNPALMWPLLTLTGHLPVGKVPLHS